MTENVFRNPPVCCQPSMQSTFSSIWNFMKSHRLAISVAVTGFMFILLLLIVAEIVLSEKPKDQSSSPQEEQYQHLTNVSNENISHRYIDSDKSDLIFFLSLFISKLITQILPDVQSHSITLPGIHKTRFS